MYTEMMIINSVVLNQEALCWWLTNAWTAKATFCDAQRDQNPFDISDLVLKDANIDDNINLKMKIILI